MHTRRLLLAAVSCLALATAARAEPIHTKGPEPLRIAFGQEVDLADYLVPGKTTVFDFTSEYCPPCRAYDQPLVRLHQQRDDIAVVKVDINRPGVKKIDWSSPVAKQYGMDSIPRFKIFGPDGKLLHEDNPPKDRSARQQINAWCEALGEE
jgi:thiol-disulfide isomerase/thioredoxin